MMADPLNPFARSKPGEWHEPEEPKITEVVSLSAYQHGIDAGRIAGLKEAAEIAEAHFAKFTKGNKTETVASAAGHHIAAAIRARITELEKPGE